MKKLLVYSILPLLLISGCISSLDRDLETHSVKFNVLKNSSWFRQDVIEIKLEEYRNELTVRIDLHCPKNFPFPIDPVYKDTLTETQFTLTFYSEGNPVPVDPQFGHFFFTDGTIDTSALRFTSFSKNVRFVNSINFRIPLYLMNRLKAGDHDLEMEIAQETFTGVHLEMEGDSIKQTISFEQKKPLINGKIKFSLKIPEIYQSTIFEKMIEIRNDSTYNPHGADFALFGPGLPDVYWEIYYPASSATDYSKPYNRSSVLANVDVYTNEDSFRLYHYKPDDFLKIGVYDRDDLSRDDVMGNWYGKISALKTRPGEWKYLSFDNVKTFAVRAESNGCINKGK